PPLLTEHGWLVLYHGVTGAELPGRHLRYSVGVLVLDAAQPERIRYRSRWPILVPGREDVGPASAWVVFPTAVDQRTDIDQPRRVDVYFGVADRKIAAGSLTLPVLLEVSTPKERAAGMPAQAANRKVAES
ncbi:MAG: hypothetical protein KGJ86_15940, partial [Chloroflexota bacterium]|nr:hypothetical protein [Chloroflexota bacterium]